MSQRKKGCQLFLLLAVTPHKGKRRTETTSEDRRQEGCQSHDKGELREWQERSPLYSSGCKAIKDLRCGPGWQAKGRGSAAGESSHLSLLPSCVADCISERTLNLIAQIDLKSFKDLTEALRGKIRKGKRGCSLSGCTWLQEATGCYPIRDFCSSKYFLGEVYNPCSTSW